MRLEIASFGLRRAELRTRLPFRYGIAVMVDVPHVFLEVSLRMAGVVHPGLSADHLPPKWFTKDPARSVEDEVREMATVIDTAVRLATGLRGASVFALWVQVHARMEAERKARNWPPLLAHFGTSLVERALIDAYCRATGQTFSQGLRRGEFGLRLEAFHPELAGTDPAHWLPARPLESVTIRHTVGLSDPLDAGDEVPPEDGLPRTLAENIACYGLHHFKIKFTGEDDLPRLERVFALLARISPDRLRFTLDGNESFQTVLAFREIWEKLCALSNWRALAGGLICVEQPFHRSVALAPRTAADLLEWSERPPLIIDESDAEAASVREALASGYVGTSHKNCKGVFKGVAAACLLAARRATSPRERFVLTGEDLCNIGPVALLQDLAVQATLGVASVERNGHHYFRGLSFLPPALQEAVRAAHPDLFVQRPDGFAAMSIVGGSIALPSVNAAPFGLGCWPALERFGEWVHSAEEAPKEGSGTIGNVSSGVQR